MTRDELLKVRDWANDKMATGAEPPWAWSMYSTLSKTIDSIVAGSDAVATTANSLEPERHQGNALRLVADNSSQDIARHRLGPPPVRLPT